jgi:hypothetical protein
MKKYKNGLDMGEFDHIGIISQYNRNYHVGIDRDLLFAKSDDDNTTEWYLVSGKQFLYLGESYCDEGDLLHRYESERT